MTFNCNWLAESGQMMTKLTWRTHGNNQQLPKSKSGWSPTNLPTNFLYRKQQQQQKSLYFPNRIAVVTPIPSFDCPALFTTCLIGSIVSWVRLCVLLLGFIGAGFASVFHSLVRVMSFVSCPLFVSLHSFVSRRLFVWLLARYPLSWPNPLPSALLHSQKTATVSFVRFTPVARVMSFVRFLLISYPLPWLYPPSSAQLHLRKSAIRYHAPSALLIFNLEVHLYL